MRVKLYYEQPRIIITNSSAQSDGSIQQTMDLRSTEATAITYPNQALAAEGTAQWNKAIAESYYEGLAIWQLSEEEPLVTTRIFDEMFAQGIQPILITPNDMDLLDLYLSDPQSYAYATQALLEGKNVLIPREPVMVDGEEVVGWWEIDPDEQTAGSVLENGLHGALIEYAMLVEIFGGLVIDG